jgi:hypothetical protein
MKIMLCSVCKKNVAVIYVNKIIEGKMQTMGLCIPCAKKQGLAPMDQIMRQSGMKPEDFGQGAGLAQQYIFYYSRQHPELFLEKNSLKLSDSKKFCSGRKL